MVELWSCWLTDSGRLNHKVVTHPASSLVQDRQSSPAENSVLTTMLRRQRRAIKSFLELIFMIPFVMWLCLSLLEQMHSTLLRNQTRPTFQLGRERGPTG